MAFAIPAVRPEAVPVRFVAVPLDGVPKAPPLVTNDPAEPTFVPKAVATPVPRPVTLAIAGVQVTCDAAVSKPLALTVKATHDVAEPKEPTFALTVS